MTLVQADRSRVVAWAALVGCALAICIGCGAPDQEEKDPSAAHDLPEVTYRLGKVPFEDLLGTWMVRSGDPAQVRVFEELQACKALFREGQGGLAMERTAALLGDLVQLGRNALDTALLAEGYHQMARSCFYMRPSEFEPGRSLLDRAMDLTIGLVHSSDTLEQQVALFQLARHNDVLQGYTNRYSTSVEFLPKDAWTKASRTAVHIKRDLLGIRGGALIRSLSNLSIDYSQMKGHAHLDDEGRSGEVACEAMRQVPELDSAELNEYGEHAQAVCIGCFKAGLEDRQLDPLRNTLELLVRIATGDPAYDLPGPIARLSRARGAEHLLYSLPWHFSTYAAVTGDTSLAPLERQLSDSVLVRTAERYASSRVSSTRGQRQLGYAQRQQSQRALEHDRFPLSGPAAYRTLTALLHYADVQERDRLVDRSLALNDPEHKDGLIELANVEVELLKAETELGSSVSQEAFQHWAHLLTRHRQLVDALKEKRRAAMEALEELSYDEVRRKLRPGEAWVVVIAGGRDAVFAVCTAENLVLDSLQLDRDHRGEDDPLGKTLELLESRVVTGATWNEEAQELLETSALKLFGERLPRDVDRLVLTSLGEPRSSILEPLLVAWADRSGRTLRSVRMDNGFHVDREAPAKGSQVMVTYLGVAPRFEQPATRPISDADLDDLMARLRRAKASKTRGLYGALAHNIPEVERSRALFGGSALVAEQVNEAAVTARMQDHQLLHFATHSLMDKSSPARSGIVLDPDCVPDKVAMDDGILRSPEIRTMDLNAELVVLSACETSIGPRVIGGYEANIASAFRQAGCRNIVSTLWKVDDQATHDIVLAFYERLATGMGKAEALFQAKMAYRAAHPGASPHYWAALQLMGDDAPLLAPLRP